MDEGKGLMEKSSSLLNLFRVNDLWMILNVQ